MCIRGLWGGHFGGGWSHDRLCAWGLVGRVGIGGGLAMGAGLMDVCSVSREVLGKKMYRNDVEIDED